MSGKLDEAFALQSAALALRTRRQAAIASNIANADTPGYRAIDVDFPRAMRAALAAGEQPRSTLVATTPGHMAPRSAYEGVATSYRVPAQAAADRNTVDMDVERARFAENTVRYEAALKSLNGQIRTLLSAIQG